MYEGTCITTAYLTPAWLYPCRGYVHSVFHRVANVILQNGEARRMLALTAPGLPRLPDSVCLPVPVLEALEPGMPAWLDKDKFQLNGRSFSLRTDNGWSGRIEPMNGQPNVRTFLQATVWIPCRPEYAAGRKALCCRRKPADFWAWGADSPLPLTTRV